MSLCVCIALRRLLIRSTCAGVKTAKAASTTAPMIAQRVRHGWSAASVRQPNTPAPGEDREQRGGDHLVAHGLAGEVVEPVAGAMGGDQEIGVDLLECGDGLPDVVVAERRHDVEAADHGVHLVDARHLLRLPSRR